jgi:hypothetical protein
LAIFEYLAGEFQRAADLAREGIAVAPSAEHRDSCLCWRVLGLAANSAGDAVAADSARLHLERIIGDARLEAHIRDFCTVPLAAMLMWSAPTEALDLLERTAANAAQLGMADNLAVRAAIHAVVLSLLDPPDLEGAFAESRRGLALAREAGVDAAIAAVLVVIALLSVRLGADEAADAIRDALARYYDKRTFHGATWLVLGAFAAHLASSGTLAPAARILGHLNAQQTGMYVPLQMVLGSAAKLLDLPSTPEVLSQQAIGAAMSRTELLRDALDIALGDSAP